MAVQQRRRHAAPKGHAQCVNRSKAWWGTTWMRGKESVPYIVDNAEFRANRDRLLALVEAKLKPGEFGMIEPEVYAYRGHTLQGD